jgi:heptosyltransferase-2
LRAGIRQRIGVRGYAGGESGFQRSIPYDPHLQVGTASLRFAALLGASILPPSRPQVFLDREERALGELAWAEHEPEGIRSRRVIVGPGGGLETKRWPAERFAELTRRLADSPQAKSLSLLVLGGPGEEDLVSRVAAASPRQAWAPPSTPSLRSVFALVQACDLVVCNSSMLLHAAAAFSKPSVTLLGPSFSSASQHQGQWGYPGLSRSLGREAAAGDRIASAEEAFDAVRAELERLEPRRGEV